MPNGYFVQTPMPISSSGTGQQNAIQRFGGRLGHGTHWSTSAFAATSPGNPQ